MLQLIEGLIVTPLKQIFHPKGDVYHAMKKTDKGFCGFGEAYFSTVIHKEIKPWKKHLIMTLNLVVPVGEIRFVVYDDRKNSLTNGKFSEIVLSQKNYKRLTVPPNVWMAFEGVGEGLNLLMNLADIEHEPTEVERKELTEYSYNW